jgi:hypothetical protein
VAPTDHKQVLISESDLEEITYPQRGAQATSANDQPGGPLQDLRASLASRDGEDVLKYFLISGSKDASP